MKADQSIIRGAIIAAGAGSRLRQAGWTAPKPLVRVAGVPLIEHVIRNFLAAGIRSLVIIFNEDERDCEEWVRARFSELDLQIIVKTTASSLESFREVAARLGPGRAVVSTVDAWCRAEDFVEFVREAGRRPAEATVLAVTPFVADERPLWVRMDESGRVTSLGGDAGDVVTAGMYVIPERVRRLTLPAGAKPEGAARLRDFLAWLVVKGEPVHGVRIPIVVDVDRGEDVALAEELARRSAGEPAQSLGDVR